MEAPQMKTIALLHDSEDVSFAGFHHKLIIFTKFH